MQTKLWNRNFTLLIAATGLGAIGGIAGGFAMSFWCSTKPAAPWPRPWCWQPS